MGDNTDIIPYLKMVCLDEEISKMKNGINTQVGSGGIRLSGGQQQRLSLARVLAHPRPLLVLDDPFSALDRKTEMEIFQNLKSLMEDRITFLISHRLYLFPQFDKVIWMDKGVCTVADHESLMKTNKIYRNLYHSQVSGKAEMVEKGGESHEE